MSSSLSGQVSNAGTALNKRLSAFRQRFSTVLGRHHGYDELSTLEQPLVQDGQPNEVFDRPEDTYFQQHGVHPGQQRFASSQSGAAGYSQGIAVASPLPDPVQELRECGDLAKEAAEILWEMAALGDTGEAATEMLGKSQQLQAQLRGMISDYNGSDESVLARALEAFETLSNTLDEYHKGAGTQAAGVPQTSPTAPGARLQPPPGSAANPFTAPQQPRKPVDEEPPLISFD